ncbi:hypothetical protein WEI85_38265 [Actinomycetes bacterium KLBMP 9797]
MLWSRWTITAPTGQGSTASACPAWCSRAMRDHLVHAAEVRSVELTGATHYAHLDRDDHGRQQFLAETTTFLARH